VSTIAFSQSVDTHRLLLLSGFGRLGPTPSFAAVIREAARLTSAYRRGADVSY